MAEPAFQLKQTGSCVHTNTQTMAASQKPISIAKTNIHGACYYYKVENLLTLQIQRHEREIMEAGFGLQDLPLSYSEGLIARFLPGVWQ